VVSLKHIDLATDEDKQFGIDRWARLFKSTTWEDIKMLAKNEPIFQDAAETLYNLNSDDTIRAQCRAREDYNRQQSAIKYHIKELTTENQQLTSKVQQVSTELQKVSSEKQQLTSENQQLASELHQVSSEKQQLSSENQLLTSKVEQLTTRLKDLEALLAAQNNK
jgi:chromosome segregation ATPase